MLAHRNCRPAQTRRYRNSIPRSSLLVLPVRTPDHDHQQARTKAKPIPPALKLSCVSSFLRCCVDTPLHEPECASEQPEVQILRMDCKPGGETGGAFSVTKRFCPTPSTEKSTTTCDAATKA